MYFLNRTNIKKNNKVCMNIKRHGLYLQFRRERPQLNRIESNRIDVASNKQNTITQQKRNETKSKNRVVLLEKKTQTITKTNSYIIKLKNLKITIANWRE